METRIEPLRAVGRCHLGGQHVAHFVEVGAGVGFGREVAALPAPVGPCAGQPVEDLCCTGFAHELFVGRHVFHRLGVGGRTPQEFRHALFTDLFKSSGHACFAEILLCKNIGGDLAPCRRHVEVLQLKNDGTVGVTNFRRRLAHLDRVVGGFAGLGEFAVDLHFLSLRAVALRRLL